jgi:hypothetical protein
MSKVKSKQTKYVVDAGVGIQWETDERGWGLKTGPYTAALFHPLRGLSVYGPFLDEDAAYRWVRAEGTATEFHFFGDNSGCEWHVFPLFVPTHVEDCNG